MTTPRRELLIINHDEVRRLLPMDGCIRAVRAALIRLARDQVHQPLRMVVRPPTVPGLLALMPSHMGGEQPAFGFKAVSVFHGNPALGRDAHQGIVLLISVATGEPLVLLDASAITAVRTAAASAVATDLLAGQGAGDLAIIGTGVQARAHLQAIPCVRKLRRVRVAGRRPEAARAFADEAAALLPDTRVEACPDARQAVEGADIIVTATTSHTPVLQHAWLTPGAHINAVGACVPSRRELDSETVRRARLYTDQRESLINEAGDFLLAQQEGVVSLEDVKGEIGELLTGQATGRTSARDITVFESLGVSVEDLAAAQLVHDAARASGAGVRVSF